MYHDVIWQKKYLPQEIFCDMVNTLCRIFAGLLQDFCRIFAGFFLCLKKWGIDAKNKNMYYFFFGCIVFFTSRKRKWVFILLLPQMGPLLSHDALIKFVLYYICTYCFKIPIYKHGLQTPKEIWNVWAKCGRQICFGSS